MQRIVETESGRVSGAEERGVLAFRGIPFARPPVGPLRFAAPAPPEPWAGVRDANAFGPSAPQGPRRSELLPGTELGRMDEDCLYLNVWTPAADGAKRPVLVWVHGGAFVGGAGSRPLYASASLTARGDAVLVTLNYRLGALGFLHLDALGGRRIDAVSNAGLLDQIAALRWVRANIERFGGDPDRVTLFGESAGGMSVGSLLGSPLAQGLFQRAVAQSGAAHNVHAPEDATRVAEAMLQALGLSGGAALDKLREVSTQAMLGAQGRVLLSRNVGPGVLPFQPVLEPTLFPEHPLAALRRGIARDVPLVTGTNRDEWNFFAALDPRMASFTEQRLADLLSERVGEGAPALLDVYGRALGGTPGERFCAIETDRVFRIPAIRLAEAQASHQRHTYAYLFTWPSPALGGRLGSCHALEVPFVFGSLALPGMGAFVGSGETATRLSERMMDAWLAFARSGHPAHASLPEWPGYEPVRRATLRLGAEVRRDDDPLAAERRAWDGVL